MLLPRLIRGTDNETEGGILHETYLRIYLQCLGKPERTRKQGPRCYLLLACYLLATIQYSPSFRSSHPLLYLLVLALLGASAYGNTIYNTVPSSCRNYLGSWFHLRLPISHFHLLIDLRNAALGDLNPLQVPTYSL
ncbi:hypothetical protein F5B21DRAFT_409853 [Xylaria acuta]|nr:hypothetical protein F5B21DRAFT_409853 [Xylaria acuta]